MTAFEKRDFVSSFLDSYLFWEAHDGPHTTMDLKARMPRQCDKQRSKSNQCCLPSSAYLYTDNAILNNNNNNNTNTDKRKRETEDLLEAPDATSTIKMARILDSRRRVAVPICTPLLLSAILLASTTTPAASSSQSSTDAIPAISSVNAEESLLNQGTTSESAAAASSSTTTSDTPTRNDDGENVVCAEDSSSWSCEEKDAEHQEATIKTNSKYGHNYNGSPSGLGSQVLEEECGVYLALSTLPGTGLGMFAGRDFQEDEILMSGDHNIPIPDMEDYHPTQEFFLWDSYTWNADAVHMDHLGKYEVSVASPGFGAAANSFMDFINVEEWLPEEGIGGYHHDTSEWKLEDIELHRSKDPGAGAVTHYHSRLATASSTIEAGQELFVSYGNTWFKDRASWLGPVPVKGDHKKAETLLDSFYTNLVEKHDGNDDKVLRNILDDFYDTLVVGLNDGIWSSRTIAALPSNSSNAHTVISEFDGNVRDWKEATMKRSVEFLRDTGVCVDNLYLDKSTIRQAGHGAFAARPLKKDAVILPVPLIHIPDRASLDMYGWLSKREDEKYGKVDFERGPTTKQLLMNYVLGHPDSTMLLSPYGPAFNYINHNQTQANVKIQWADPLKSNHHPELLNKSVGAFEDIKFSGLAFELVALRDISKDEEIFLDYGNEWEHAWNTHVKKWKPVDGADQYKSASQMNKSPTRLKTVFEQLTNPYPSNLVLQINTAFLPVNGHDDDFTPSDITYADMAEDGTIPCDVLRYEVVEDLQEMDNVDDPEPGKHYYHTVVVKRKKKGVEQDMIYEKIPRRAFKFWDHEQMSMDFYLPNAFRQPLGIPDGIMPEAWKNLKHSRERSMSS